MRISDWSSDVCSSDLDLLVISHFDHDHISGIPHLLSTFDVKRILIPLVPLWARLLVASQLGLSITQEEQSLILDPVGTLSALPEGNAPDEIVIVRSEEHTSELQSLMRISYAVFCLKKKNTHSPTHTYSQHKM